MRVQIIKDHDYRLMPAVTQAFKASDRVLDVPRKTGAALVKAGAAIEIKKSYSKSPKTLKGDETTAIQRK